MRALTQLLRRRIRTGVSLAVLAGVICARPCAAEQQWKLRPAVIVSGGLDDNLLFNNTGGDRVGRAGLRLNLKTWERLWSFSLDAGASVFAFQQRQKIVPLGESTLNTTVQIDRMDVFRARARVRGSDDPLGLAQIGLLGAEGTVLGYRSYAEYEHLFDERMSVASLATFDGIGYLDTPFQSQSGEAVGVGVQPRFRLTRDLMLIGGFAERTFLTQGLAGLAVDLLPGLRYRVARRFYLEVSAGPSIFHDDQGFLPLPVATLDATYDTRHFGVAVTASQDLAVPSGRAGVLMTDLSEVTAHYHNDNWELRVRGGYYRSLSSPRSSEWVPGYGGQLDAYCRIAPFAWVGMTALRFQRLGTSFQAPLVRDAIYAQVELTQGRP